MQKEIVKPFPMLQSKFIEILSIMIESSETISEGQTIELMKCLVHLLECRRVNFYHKLMGLENDE